MFRWMSHFNRRVKQTGTGPVAGGHPADPAAASPDGGIAGGLENGRSAEALPQALVFVDFEHWYYGLKKSYGFAPDPLDWRNELAEAYDITQLFVFANFGDPQLADQLQNIRQITNDIIETRSSTVRTPKDMTDFIILDKMYQCADACPEVSTYILFTGDGHFQSVVKYLRQRKNKTVIIYGIKGGISKALKAAADECIELPFDSDVLKKTIGFILRNLDHFDAVKKVGQYATFSRTVEVVSEHYQADEVHVRAALSWLIDRGYISKVRVRLRLGPEIPVLKVDWEKTEQAGLWKPEPPKALD